MCKVMKKIKLILPILILALFIPFMVNAETCDINKITINSITLEEKSDNVKELEEARVNGKNINLNLSMSEVGDNVKYKITVKNDSNEGYELDKNSFNLNSDYIDYVLESEDDTNIIKANSSKTIYLIAEYKNEVPEDKFESGIFNDNKSLIVNMSTKNMINVLDTLKNPNTGDSILLVSFFILLILGISFIIFRKTKYTKSMILIVGIMIIIPMSVYALCKVEIKFESKVQIKKAFTGSVNRSTSMTISNGQRLQKENFWEMIAGGQTINKYKTKEECMSNPPSVSFECVNKEDFDFGKTISQEVYVKHDIEKNIVKKTYVCFSKDGAEYCVQGGENFNYEQEKQTLIAEFGESNCSVYDGHIYCGFPNNISMKLFSNGEIFTKKSTCGPSCRITSDGVSSCEEGKMFC